MRVPVASLVATTIRRLVAGESRSCTIHLHATHGLIKMCPKTASKAYGLVWSELELHACATPPPPLTLLCHHPPPSGVIESLARRVLTVDLDLAKQVVMHQQAAMQRSQQQGQDQQQRAAGAAPPPELVSVGLLALAKLAAPDTALQGWLLGGSGRGAGAGVARARLAEGLVLSRVDEVMRSGGTRVGHIGRDWSRCNQDAH